MISSPAKPPTVVVVIFDQKNRKAKLLQDASSVLRYIARLQGLPGPYAPPVSVVDYVLRDEAVVAFAANGFETSSLSGMARELNVDILAADKRIDPVLVHGTISKKVSPDRPDQSAEEFLAVGHRLMELFGVDKNRYILAVHADSDHLHLHFFYSRVVEGKLQERERKLPKFMAEEACAVLAHEFGFGLEPRHMSRVVPGGVIDLASGQLTRDGEFDAVPRGSAARSAARMSMSGNDLRKIALVSLHLAKGDLGSFRSELAEHGISYIPVGSGSHLVDVLGNSIPAGGVDPRLRLGKIKLNGVAQGLPPEPAEIQARAEERRAELKPLAIPDADPADEWERYARDRTPSRLPLDRHKSQADWCDDDMRRAIREEKRGRRKKRAEAVQWPTDTRATGAIGSPSFLLSTIAFEPSIYKKVDQAWQTEFWRGRHLVATVRYNRLSIYSKKEDDLRAALLAAQKAWGTVEIFGDKKFKGTMVKLAAELGVELSNPELQAPLADARSRRKPDWLTTDAPSILTDSPVVLRADSAPSPNAMLDRPERSTANEVSAQPDPSLIEKPIQPARPTAEALVMSAFALIDETRAPLVATLESNLRIVLLEPSKADHFRLSEDDQRRPDVQFRLQILFDRQEQEQNQILDAISASQATIVQSKDPYRETVVYKVVTDADHLAAFAHLHQMNMQWQDTLAKRWKSLKRIDGSKRHAAEALLAAPEQPDQVSDIAGTPINRQSDVDNDKSVSRSLTRTLARLLANFSLEQPAPNADDQLQPEVTAAKTTAALNGDRPADDKALLQEVAGEHQPSFSPGVGAARVESAVPDAVRKGVNVLVENISPGNDRSAEVQKAPPSPEVERLVAFFIGAKTPADLRKAVVAIRAIPVAKLYMEATKDKRWIAENLTIDEEQRVMRESIDRERG